LSKFFQNDFFRKFEATLIHENYFANHQDEQKMLNSKMTKTLRIKKIF